MKRSILFFVILAFLMMGSSALFFCIGRELEPKIRDRNEPVSGIRAEKPGTIDVLVLGDSESYTSLSPQELWAETGITSYICGQSGQRVVEAYYMLRQALKTQRPKLVILETNMIFRYSSRMEELQIVASEIGNYYLPVFRYHNLWKTAVDGVKNRKSFYRKGFSIRRRAKPYTGGAYMKETGEKEEIRHLVKLYLSAIQKLCEKNEIPLLFITAPAPRNHTTRRHNAMVQYTKERGIPYLDLNMETETLGIDWEKDSLDAGDHLNFSGAQKVSSYMAGYLKTHYALEDHRGDERYLEWEKDAKKYRKVLKKYKKLQKK